jgi:hypothetical protein
MENIEIQRTGFDKIRVVLIGINQGEKFGKPLREIEMNHGDQDKHEHEKNRNPVACRRYAFQTLKHKTRIS